VTHNLILLLPASILCSLSPPSRSLVPSLLLSTSLARSQPPLSIPGVLSLSCSLSIFLSPSFSLSLDELHNHDAQAVSGGKQLPTFGSAGLDRLRAACALTEGEFAPIQPDTAAAFYK